MSNELNVVYTAATKVNYRLSQLMCIVEIHVLKMTTIVLFILYLKI